MELNFVLSEEELYDQGLLLQFCDTLVESIRTDILEGLVPAKYPLLEEGLLNATWITWEDKPNSINIEKLIKAILKCITWRQRRLTYQVYIRTDVKMPGTVNTSLESIARFIDKGNNVTKYSTLISRVFNKYEKDIGEYWEAYREVGYIVELDERNE